MNLFVCTMKLDTSDMYKINPDWYMFQPIVSTNQETEQRLVPTNPEAGLSLVLTNQNTDQSLIPTNQKTDQGLVSLELDLERPVTERPETAVSGESSAVVGINLAELEEHGFR